jgi:type IX secretion system PorP/SprF family membrane protein
MKNRILLLFAILMLVGMKLEAQDIHFSQYYASPLTLNPALTGKFNGLYRVTGIYRDQFRNSVSQNPMAYMTPSLSVDFSLLKNKLKTDALGIGAVVLFDQIGGLQTTKAALSLAYHKGLDKNNKYHLALGLQGIYGNRNINSEYTFEEELIANPTFQDDQFIASMNGPVNSVDMNVGLLFDGQFTDWMTFYGGYSFMNILRHEDDFLANPAGDPSFETPFRHVAHAGFEFEVKKFLIIPGVLYQTTAKTREINFGSTFGYKLENKKEKTTTLFLGAWYRWDVALIAKAGIDFENFRVSGAYDLGIVGLGSDLRNDVGARMPNAFELAISYFGPYGTPPAADSYLFNPRF